MGQDKIKIEPGIYRHFKGKLYFILALAWSRNHPNDPTKAEVIYHPLYPCEDCDWKRDISLSEFTEHINRPEFNYSGPRFFKIADWEYPDILPGCKFTDRNGDVLEILRCYNLFGKDVTVECTLGVVVINLGLSFVKKCRIFQQ